VSLVSVVFFQVEVSARGRSLVPRRTADCGVFECDREAWVLRRTWSTRAVAPLKKYGRNVTRGKKYESRNGDSPPQNHL